MPGQRWDSDPTYQAARAALIAQRHPCWRCGRDIDYDGPRYRIINGRRRENPNAFDADHWPPRSQGGGPTDLRPAHVKCNRAHGAALTNNRDTRIIPFTTKEW
jgi:5-methylcytosine-specific restriction endonuclease McrA